MQDVLCKRNHENCKRILMSLVLCGIWLQKALWLRSWMMKMIPYWINILDHNASMYGTILLIYFITLRPKRLPLSICLTHGIFPFVYYFNVEMSNIPWTRCTRAAKLNHDDAIMYLNSDPSVRYKTITCTEGYCFLVRDYALNSRKIINYNFHNNELIISRNYAHQAMFVNTGRMSWTQSPRIFSTEIAFVW